MRMIVVSGLSGSGKSIALETLEDLNHYCVDNLPVELLPPFAETVLTRGEAAPPTTAVGIDARNFPDALARFPDILTQLRASGLEVEILFLQADNETLLKRYSETRRPHPLGLDGIPLAEAIQRERELLEPIAAQAKLIVDTSQTNVHELRQLIRTRVGDRPSGVVSLLFISFGFRNGIPDDADFVFDVRCLPNPHWEPRLRRFTGLDEQVERFLGEQPEVQRMVDDLGEFLGYWIPRFEADDRSYITVAVGCTGGQHRSVYITETLARRFRRQRPNVMTRHRELH